MPRITIEYGDDEQAAAREAMAAPELAAALSEIDSLCRAWIKHVDITEDERARLEMIRENVPEIVREG